MTAMPSLRDPDTLHPILRPVYYECQRRWRAAGLIVILTFAWRSRGAQNQLWQIGRRGVEGEKIVTRARGGQSWHNVERDGMPSALAFDVACLTTDGKRVLPDTDPAWQRAGEIAETGIGLTWGIRYGRMDFDLGHYQMDDRGELKLADAMAGRDPQPLIVEAYG